MPLPGKTYSAKPSEITASWYIVDASGQTLGRLAANVAKVLRGKHKPMYSPRTGRWNSGSGNVGTSRKGRPGSNSRCQGVVWKGGRLLMSQRSAARTGNASFLPTADVYARNGDMVVKHPTYPFRHAVGGMLQHGTLGKEQLRRLKVYAGDAHPHKAQQPVPIRFGVKGEIEVIGR